MNRSFNVFIGSVDGVSNTIVKISADTCHVVWREDNLEATMIYFEVEGDRIIAEFQARDVWKIVLREVVVYEN